MVLVLVAAVLAVPATLALSYGAAEPWSHSFLWNLAVSLTGDGATRGRGDGCWLWKRLLGENLRRTPQVTLRVMWGQAAVVAIDEKAFVLSDEA
ncbi:hypothetical protein C8A05DRAFT_38651 [Staphylotrichum tortipilum]|uniref:Uncharacterized protein n=1 Tax=Staphylotrichum tortipilum TaxID=2831512 RepID=A0AAN6MD50_9PEZI|nr:hypothetical protein C8A05DRAFT_38651 [Staphylotrichum longicolle]